MFLKIFQNSQKNIGLFFNKIEDLGLQLFKKRDSGTGMSFAEFSRTSFFAEHHLANASDRTLKFSPPGFMLTKWFQI